MAVERLGAGGRGPGLGPQPQDHDPEDLAWAEGVLAGAVARGDPYRVGHGFDAHRLVSGRPLLLGGVQSPTSAASRATPTATASIHALCDALLGAAAAGDMGRHFPSSDPRWKGADSLVFLEEVARLLGERG